MHTRTVRIQSAYGIRPGLRGSAVAGYRNFVMPIPYYRSPRRPRRPQILYYKFCLEVITRETRSRRGGYNNPAIRVLRPLGLGGNLSSYYANPLYALSIDARLIRGQAARDQKSFATSVFGRTPSFLAPLYPILSPRRQIEDWRYETFTRIEVYFSSAGSFSTQTGARQNSRKL
jgi:hypothetical protein